MIAVIDYGAGNLHSVQNAMNFLGANSVIAGDADTILNADKVILPGVGSFGAAMESICRYGLDEVIKEAINRGTPFLGICLGLQLLFEKSEESPGVKGLGIFKGEIVKIPDCGFKIPHMGWNSIALRKHSRILQDNNPFMYFVHSYYLKNAESGIVSAYTEYGVPLDIAVERDNVFAVQFHPEKSGEAGMKILKNFIEL